ncbi:type VI secretion system lipoprotein TssJ [Allopusillimonas ginsengisoli]|uniref:type VI secretion system lipoprotein TssJ n=1 Tax=Allopusillimonas ginsengisoli TaxID=453575 RepID=UPI0026D28716
MPQPCHFRRNLMPVRLLACILCSVALTACSSMNSMLGGSSEKNALKELQWSYAADGLQIAIQADPMLNEANGQPHMLTLLVVQMETPNAFTDQTADAVKMKNLLLAQSTPQGMLSLDRLFIAPGEKKSIQLGRAEKAQYIGLVAGYNHQDTARSSRLYRIGVQVDSSGFLVKTRAATPEALSIDLRLGPDSILEAPGTETVPADPVKPEAGPVTPQSTSSNSTSGQL